MSIADADVLTQPAARISLAGKRVILAEDDVTARTIIAKVLRAMELEVIETTDGGRLLVAVTSYYKEGRSPEELDLVITDVRMPVMSGLEIFKGMRSAHWTLPVIVMTAFASAEVSDVVSRYGATLLIKPLDLDVLESVVMRLLAGPHRPSR